MEIYMIDLLSRNMVSFPYNRMWLFLWFWSHGWIFHGYR